MASRFGFTNITLNNAADISNVMVNFNLIEDKAALKSELTSINTALSNQITNLSTSVSNNTTAISGKAPTSHASSATTYGVGTTSNYGHCKVINNLTTDAFSNGTALSAYQGYLLQNNKAPNNHASSEATYGLGTGDNYGHTKIINNLTTSANTDGFALSAYQGKVLNDSKAPNNHASSATTYGVGTTANYGHCKIANNLTQSAYANGVVLSAYQGYLLNQNKAPNNHASTATTYGVGTKDNYGHCKIIDALTSTAYVDGQVLSAYQGKILNDSIAAKAPTSHASTATTYGVGTGSSYGHCMIINNLTTASNTNGYALSAYQGKVLNDKFANYLPLAGGSITGIVKPNANNTIDLGTSSLKFKTIYATTFNGTATTANEVILAVTNPASATSYYLPFYTGITNNNTYTARANNGLKYQTREGTTSAVGLSELILGNNVESGTEGNKAGSLLLYSTNAKYGYLKYEVDAAGNYTNYLPASNGTLLNTVNYSNYALPKSSAGALATKTYSYGTAAPSGGSNGDLYDQYF